ncbi:hypothetical protein [Okeania sp. SIO2C2]|nr:hypothetical protein [Okeania sp. SIO2C2]
MSQRQSRSPTPELRANGELERSDRLSLSKFQLSTSAELDL